MVKLNSKTLFTVVGVVCLFCIRLCTQTSEAKNTTLWQREKVLIGQPHDVPACFLLEP